MNYEFVIGRQFDVGGRLYQALGVFADGDSTVVQAVAKDDGSRQAFNASVVVDHLIVDEEIELHTPRFTLI